MKYIKLLEAFSNTKTYESSPYNVNDYVLLNRLIFPSLPENTPMEAKIIDITEGHNLFYWVLKLATGNKILWGGDWAIIRKLTPEEIQKYYKNIKLYKIKNYNLSFITEKKLDNPEYKKYIITKFYFHNKYLYINLYENLSSKKLLFRYLYYYDKEDNIIKEYIDKHETNYISFDNIIYQSDNLSDAMKMLEKEVEKVNTYKKYRIDK